MEALEFESFTIQIEQEKQDEFLTELELLCIKHSKDNEFYYSWINTDY